VKTSLPESPSRDAVFKFIFEASKYGNLGLFVGAGFSKAVLNDDDSEIALSWGALLETVAKKLEVPIDDLMEPGRSYPEIASSLCKAYADKAGKSHDEALGEMKATIAAQTAWFPEEPARSKYASYLRRLLPRWIITTNYDQVLECLLSGRSVSLGPNDIFSASKKQIPIYHLHGCRTKPIDIIIAQEDYVSLFRPAEYRQIKLALTIKESTTCILGYGLGDVNVLTALDWSNHVFEEKRGAYPHEVIQVLYAKKPAEKPYRSSDGIVVLETASIENFFDEYLEASIHFRSKRKTNIELKNQAAALFKDAEPDRIKRFIDEEDWRRRILAMSKDFGVDVLAELETFLNACLEECKLRSAKNNAFGAYAHDLRITLDLLDSFEVDSFPPALLFLATKNLNRVAPYIGDSFGTSWEAKKVWTARKDELSPAKIAELRSIARQYHLGSVRMLLDDL
jgi:hypothetical protein